MKMSKRAEKKLQYWLIFIQVIFLAACVDGTQNSIRKNSVIYCSEGSPESFNPQLITSMLTVDATSHQIYNRLLEYKTGSNELQPALANSWHVTRDGKIITFYLRKDVTFHNTDFFTPTRLMTADDVVFSFNRILDKNHPYHMIGGGKYPFFQSVGFVNLVEKIEKINDHTIRFHLNQPDSSFLANLATDFAIVLSAEYGEQLAKQNAEFLLDILPVGTGPYKFVEYVPGSLIRYYKNENYWRHPINIEQLIFDITPSNTGRLTKLLTQECDVIAYPIAHKQINAHPNITLEQVTSFNVSYLAFNTQQAPFDNSLVRKAIAHAIDRNAIISAVYNNQATVAESLLPPASWAYSKDIKSPEYAPEKAKALLTEAGFEQGFDMTLWAMPVQRAYNPNALKMAKLIQSDLARIGINLSIESYEWTVFSRKMSLGEHQAALIGWSADHADPDNFFTPLLSCNSTAIGSNRTSWCDTEFDALIRQSLLTNNNLTRKRLYTKAQMIVADQTPLFPIAHSKRFQAKSTGIEGETLSSFGGLNFSQVRKK